MIPVSESHFACTSRQSEMEIISARRGEVANHFPGGKPVSFIDLEIKSIKQDRGVSEQEFLIGSTVAGPQEFVCDCYCIGGPDGVQEHVLKARHYLETCAPDLVDSI